MASDETKAVQEVAKAAREYRPEVREFGAFVGRVIGRPAEQFGGLVGDVIAGVRLELGLRFKGRVDQLMREQGLDGPTRAAPLAVAFPLLEAATLEDDEDIQELFAQLLVNAVNADSGPGGKARPPPRAPGRGQGPRGWFSAAQRI